MKKEIFVKPTVEVTVFSAEEKVLTASIPPIILPEDQW